MSLKLARPKKEMVIGSPKLMFKAYLSPKEPWFYDYDEKYHIYEFRCNHLSMTLRQSEFDEYFEKINPKEEK